MNIKTKMRLSIVTAVIGAGLLIYGIASYFILKTKLDRTEKNIVQQLSNINGIYEIERDGKGIIIKRK